MVFDSTRYLKIAKNQESSLNGIWNEIYSDVNGLPGNPDSVIETKNGQLVISYEGSYFYYSDTTGTILTLSQPITGSSGGGLVYLESDGNYLWYAFDGAGNIRKSIIEIPSLTSNWTLVSSPSPIDYTSDFVAFAADTTGVNGTVIAITNKNYGGVNYSEIIRSTVQGPFSHVQTITADFITKVISLGNNTWIASGYGETPTIYRSVDDGITWTLIDISQFSSYLTDEEWIVINGFATNGTGGILAIAEGYTQPPHILYSGNYGATWLIDTVFGGSTDSLISVVYHDGEYVILTESNKILTRREWALSSTTDMFGQQFEINGLYAVDSLSQEFTVSGIPWTDAPIFAVSGTGDYQEGYQLGYCTVSGHYVAVVLESYTG